MLRRIANVFLVALLIPAGVLVAGSKDASDADVSTEIPVIGSLGFQPRARSDLFPRPEATIHLSVPVVYPSRTYAAMEWIVAAYKERPHTVLRGRDRFQRYKEVLRELVYQSGNPAVESLLQHERMLLDQISPDAPLSELADSIDTRAATMEDDRKKILGQVSHSLRNLSDEATVVDVRRNGTLRAIVLGAFHFMDVRRRLDALDALVESGDLQADDVYTRALGAVRKSAIRNRVLRHEVLRQLLRFGLSNPSPDVLASASIPILPKALAERLFGDTLDDGAIDAIGVDMEVRVADPMTPAEFLRVHSNLILMATIYEDLPADSLSAPNAALLRPYMERHFHHTLASFLERLDDEFVAERFGWEVAPLLPHAPSREELLRLTLERVAACDGFLILQDEVRAKQLEAGGG